MSSRRPPVLRSIALLVAGSLALHDLRYAFGYGSRARAALVEHGHGYLTAFEGLAVLLALAAVAGLGLGLLRARLGDGQPGSPGSHSPGAFGHVWLGSGAALWTIYVVQEWLEGLMAAGHPAGLAGVVGQGGWIAALLAVAIGALVALALRGAERALEWAAVGRRTRVARLSADRPAPPRASARPRVAPIATHGAERAPPALPV